MQIDLDRQKTLLLNPPSDFRHFPSVQPPLGILYIASYLRRNKKEVVVADLNIQHKWKNVLKLLIKTHCPSIIGISANFANRARTLEALSLIRSFNRNIITVVGGPDPTIDYSRYLSPNLDYIIPFEAEKAMLDFVNSDNKCSLPGIIYGNSIVAGQLDPRSFKNSFDDLDCLPFPAYDLIDISKYYINSYKQRPIASMITSRGCPSQCIFCSQGVSGRYWRARSPQNVVDEIIWLKDRIGVKEISIEDDNFTLDLERVHKICELMLSKGIKIEWQLANGIRADRVTKDLLRTMKAAGCWKIAIAPEVGNEEVLRKIRKGISLEQFRRVASWCKELGMVYYGFFLMGFPFEDIRNMEETIRFAMELDPLLLDLSKVVPFPGTELYNIFSGNKLDSYKNNFSYYYTSDDPTLERMYKNAYIKFYFRPHKLAEIIKEIGLRRFFSFVKYAFFIFIMRQRNIHVANKLGNAQ